MKKINKLDKLKKRLVQTKNSKDPHKEEKITIIENQINNLMKEVI